MLPVAILGTDEFDVSDIDVTTVHIMGVEPLRYNYEDVAAPLVDGDECECWGEGPDGYMDLTLKFEKSEIVAALGSVGPGDLVPIEIEGYLNNGVPFEGVDCMRVLGSITIDRRSDTGGGTVLGPAIPNPFNPRTRISYFLPADGDVTISVYDVTGRLVEVLLTRSQSAGEHTVEWNATNVPSGIYFYRLQFGDFNEARKMILIK
jgi:hypothetical protein